MVKLLDPTLLIEEGGVPPRLFPGEVGPGVSGLDIAMPRVYCRPPAPIFTRGNAWVPRLVAQARHAHQTADGPGLGKAYSALLTEFHPAIRWALSCWEFLLSTEGCRFVPRSMDEKRYCRGDYRVFTERDFHRFVHRVFKECLVNSLGFSSSLDFIWTLQQTFWLTLLKSYRALENPPDPRQRRLTAYSYLRCVPYQFLNEYHQERVAQAIEQLPCLERQVVELYYLNFYKEEAVLDLAQSGRYALRRRRGRALRTMARHDALSYSLLLQIERY